MKVDEIFEKLNAFDREDEKLAIILLCKKYIEENSTELTFAKLINLCCGYFGKDAKKVISKSQKRDLTDCRKVIMVVAFLKVTTNLSEIGRKTHRHHATVKDHIKEYESNNYFTKMVDNFINTFQL